MLNKELLRYGRHRDGLIFPRFIDTQNRVYRDLAGEMVEIYSQSQGLSREEIMEMIQPAIDGSRSSLIAKGLNKLLLDRCEFREPDPRLEEIRLSAFKESTRQLSSSTVGHLEIFRDSVAQALGTTAEALTNTLFSDLANRQTLEKFRPLLPEKLLHRYNMALVQGLLLSTWQLDLEIIDPDAGRLRQFFRQLKFFRLLATIQQRVPGHYHLVLDGPLSLFEQVRKYGLQFATLLPAICHLEKWELTAQIHPKGENKGRVKLDQDSGLVSHYPISSAYIPPEFARFAEQFIEQGTDWTLLPDIQPLRLEGTDLIVPDFSFRHTSGLVVHLEMFHRWHRAPLHRRLQQLKNTEKAKKLPQLAIAVDRHLAKEGDTTQKLEQSPSFQARGFLFNEFPVVKRALKCLES
ncbi:MAG TPA: DUF790 family protein, partial [Magnetococcales bacterium]|nr:DUF790 family protein [Magnetococcales bacterium]